MIHYYNHHFIDEKTEAQRSLKCVQNHSSSKCQSSYSNPWVPDIRTYGLNTTSLHYIDQTISLYRPLYRPDHRAFPTLRPSMKGGSKRINFESEWTALLLSHQLLDFFRILQQLNLTEMTYLQILLHRPVSGRFYQPTLKSCHGRC